MEEEEAEFNRKDLQIEEERSRRKADYSKKVVVGDEEDCDGTQYGGRRDRGRT